MGHCPSVGGRRLLQRRVRLGLRGSTSSWLINRKGMKNENWWADGGKWNTIRCETEIHGMENVHWRKGLQDAGRYLRRTEPARLWRFPLQVGLSVVSK